LDGYAHAQRQSLPWIVAVPLMVAGTIAAHSLTAILRSARAETGAETAERLVFVSLGRRFLMRRRSGPSATVFLVLPPLAFLFAELLERVFGAESFPFQPSLEPRLLLGLVLQLPFGLVAFLVARVLLRAIERVVERIARARFGGRPRATTTRFVPVSVVLPRIPALALGYQERGPPEHR